MTGRSKEDLQEFAEQTPEILVKVPLTGDVQKDRYSIMVAKSMLDWLAHHYGLEEVQTPKEKEDEGQDVRIG